MDIGNLKLLLVVVLVLVSVAMEALHPSHSGEDGGEGLATLPRHTKVLVTGNNRTKSVLVGLQGVVTKAVGLGGWHWLMLTNGDEVKLQRNALSVIEAPSGGQENDDIEDNPFSNETSLDKNFPRNSFRVHSRKPALPTSSNPGVLASPRRAGQCGTSFHRPEGLEEGGGLASKCLPSVNLSKLETAILKRYRSHFKLVEVGPNSSKEQLVDAVVRHFMSQELDEGQVIMGFMQAAKRLRG